MEAADLVGQNQVGADAAAGEVPDAVGVFGPVGVGVEVPHAVPPGVLEDLDDVEGVTDPLGAETEVLVELADPLGVEVDVEELLLPEGLGDGVGEGQAAHRLVGELGVDSDHVGLLERPDEGEGVTDGRKEDVAPRLVRLGLEGDAQAQAAVGDVLAAEVDRFLVAVQCQADVLGGVGLDPLAPSPHHEDIGAELAPELDGLACLLDGEPTDAGIVGREGPLLEDGPREEVRGDHRDLQAGLVEGPAEPLEDLVAARWPRTRRGQGRRRGS